MPKLVVLAEINRYFSKGLLIWRQMPAKLQNTFSLIDSSFFSLFFCLAAQSRKKQLFREN